MSWDLDKFSPFLFFFLKKWEPLEVQRVSNWLISTIIFLYDCRKPLPEIMPFSRRQIIFFHKIVRCIYGIVIYKLTVILDSIITSIYIWLLSSLPTVFSINTSWSSLLITSIVWIGKTQQFFDTFFWDHIWN